jgi:hypothetical protein
MNRIGLMRSAMACLSTVSVWTHTPEILWVKGDSRKFHVLENLYSSRRSLPQTDIKIEALRQRLNASSPYSPSIALPTSSACADGVAAINALPSGSSCAGRRPSRSDTYLRRNRRPRGHRRLRAGPRSPPTRSRRVRGSRSS